MFDDGINQFLNVLIKDLLGERKLQTQARKRRPLHQYMRSTWSAQALRATGLLNVISLTMATPQLFFHAALFACFNNIILIRSKQDRICINLA